MPTPRASVIPELIDALLEAFQGLPGLSDWHIEDGFGRSDTAKPVLYVGVDDPFTDGPTPAATHDIEWKTDAGRDESGAINCYATAWHAGGDQKKARDKCADALAAVQAFLRARPLPITLPNCPRLSLDFAGGQLGQDQTKDGALALWSFQVTFTARI